jgi:hypothetical protein
LLFGTFGPGVLGFSRMTPEDRERMFELCRLIDRETDPRKLAVWIRELNLLIRRKIDELRRKQDIR